MRNNRYYINMMEKNLSSLKKADFLSVFFTIFGVLFLGSAFAFEVYGLAVVSIFVIILAIFFATKGIILKMRTHKLYSYFR